jgi:hypothetical protein
MLNKILCFIVLGFFAGVAPLSAQTSATSVGRVKGRISAARVQGHVEAISKAGGAPRVLRDGDQLSDQTTVVTAPGASVILVFSNGATVNVAQDSSLDIDQFEQDPFTTDLNMGALKREPGTSTTRLNLSRGELVGKVVHLNVEIGSEFSVQTPVGAAGIRGTTFRIVFRPDKNGKAFFVVTTAEGFVVFHGTTAGPVNIPAGKTVVATFDYTPPSGNASPGTGTTGPVNVESKDVSPVELAQIDGASQAIVTANAVTNFPANTGGPSATPQSAPSTTTTPPAPVITPPVITSGAGSS